MRDGRTLPRYASGVYATAVWGMLGLVAIEGMVILSLVASWFYLRFHNPRWPPPGIDLPDLWLPALRTGLLVVAGAFAGHAARSAFTLRGRVLGRWMLASALLMAAYLAWQVVDLAAKPYGWQDHAYTSIDWTMSVYAGLHALTAMGLQLAVTRFTWADRLGGNEPVALQSAAIYGIFVAISSVLTWLTLNLAPHLL